MAETQTVQMEGNITGSEAPEQEVQQEKPDWLPEKFNSPEDMAKAYGELEKQFTQSRQAETQEKVPEVETPDVEDAKEAVESVGLDFDAMSQEFMDTGELSEATYAELAEKGIPQEIVDAYINGQQAIASGIHNEIYNSVGGQDNYNSMINWATENMNEGEIDAFNNAVNSGSLDTARLAVEGLSSRFRSVNGTEPNLVEGKSSSSVDAYQSWAQVTKDMKSAEYTKDAAYREAVQKKLSRSNIA
jgi:hypothetical protein